MLAMEPINGDSLLPAGGPTPKLYKVPPKDLATPESDPLTGNQEKSSRSVSPSSLFIQIGVTSAISMMHLAAGVGFGYTGIILPSITDPNSGDIYMNTEQVSLYSSVLSIGSLTGSLMSGPLSIRYGQRTSLLLIIPLAIIGWLTSYFSYSFWLHIVSRIVVGIFASAACGISVTYVAETVHSSLRGRLLAITDLARQMGFFFVFVVGSTSLNWRTVGVVCGLLPVIIPAIVLLLVPNSPRWLVGRGAPECEAKRSLKFFNGHSYDIQGEFDEILDDIKSSKRSATIWQQLSIMKEKSLMKRLILLVYLNIGAIFTGNAAVVTYSVEIFQSAHTNTSPYLSTVICGGVRILGSLIYIAMADRLGRRFLSIVFLTLGGLSTTSLGVYFYLKYTDYDTSSISWLPLVSLILYTLFTCLAHPVIRLLRSELLPNSVRSLGVNLLYFVFFLSSFVAILLYPFMAEGIGVHWTFWVYSINSVMMAIVIFLFLPETKGKTLEEIAKLF